MKIDGRAIRKRREKLGLSQERLAALVGVSSGTIERVEGFKGDVAAIKAYRIARALDLPLESLFIDSDEAVT
jgi:transcriptional regulator with XRE-family HTH domain